MSDSIITLGAASMAEATIAAEALTWNSASARAAATSRRNLAACAHQRQRQSKPQRRCWSFSLKRCQTRTLPLHSLQLLNRLCMPADEHSVNFHIKEGNKYHRPCPHADVVSYNEE